VAQSILEAFEKTGALLNGHFVLSSGLHSGQYFQCALVLQHTEIASQICADLAAKLADVACEAVISPAMGGIIVDSGRFPWEKHAERFPMLTKPDESYHGLVYTQHYGPLAYLGRCRSVFQRTMGAVLAPLNAFLLLQGIETVALRMERHVENAHRVAHFLREDRRVASVRPDRRTPVYMAMESYWNPSYHDPTWRIGMSTLCTCRRMSTWSK